MPEYAPEGASDLTPGLTNGWPLFAEALGLVVEEMCPGDALRFSAPPDAVGRRSRCVLRRSRKGLLWATAVPAGDPDAEEVVAHGTTGETPPVVTAVVRLLAVELAVPAPALLTVRARGVVSRHAALLGLPGERGVPTGSDPMDEESTLDVAVPVHSHEEVRQRVAWILEQITGEAPTVDPDGDLVVTHVGTAVHVTADHDVPTIRVWAEVVPHVRSQRDASLTLGRLNREEEWTTWILRGRTVVQRTVLTVDPLVPRHLHHVLRQFLFTLACTRDELRLRL